MLEEVLLTGVEGLIYFKASSQVAKKFATTDTEASSPLHSTLPNGGDALALGDNRQG